MAFELVPFLNGSLQRAR